MSGKVLLELASAFDVVAGEVLLVGAVDSDCAEHVEGKATAEVESHGVLFAVVEKALEA